MNTNAEKEREEAYRQQIESMRTWLKEQISQLSPMQQQVLSLRFGIGADEQVRSTEEIAILLRRPKWWVRSIEEQALKQLRANIATKEGSNHEADQGAQEEDQPGRP